MKLSGFIKRLKKIRAEHGNIEVDLGIGDGHVSGLEAHHINAFPYEGMDETFVVLENQDFNIFCG